MRHLWGFASAIGLLVLVVFGTWACLTASTDDASTSTSALVALAGGGVMAISLVARGDGTAALAKTRSVIGAIGLIVTPIAGVLTLLAIATGPSAALPFLLVTLIALAAWAQAIAAQVGISIRVSFLWLATLVLFAMAVLTLFAVIAWLVVEGLGVESDLGTRVAFALTGAAALAAVGGWVSRDDDRKALPGTLRRAALGKSGPGDVALLATGPRPFLRRRPIATDIADVGALLSEVDARLAPAEVEPKDDGGTPAG